MDERISLQPVDSAVVTIVVDNFVDILLPSTETVVRAPLHYDWSERFARVHFTVGAVAAVGFGAFLLYSHVLSS